MRTFTIPELNIEFYQHKHSQSVSEDAYNLYLKAKEYIINSKAKKILDLGCGNGIILLMLAKDLQNLAFTGVDILAEMIDIAVINFQKLCDYLNKKINLNFIVADYGKEICDLSETKFDMIVANPPYYPQNTGNISPIPEKAIARFESTATQADLLNTIKKYLAPKGKSFIIYPFSRKKEFEENCSKLALNIIADNAVEYKNKMFDKLTSKDKIIFEIEHAAN